MVLNDITWNWTSDGNNSPCLCCKEATYIEKTTRKPTIKYWGNKSIVIKNVNVRTLKFILLL